MLIYIILTIYFKVLVTAVSNSCPEVKTIENFDFKRYTTGRWFELARYSQFETEKGGDCVTFNYNNDVDPATMVLREVVQGKEILINTTVAQDAKRKGVLNYRVNKTGQTVSAHILDADYDNYVISYDCTFDNDKQSISEKAWVRSRTPTMKPEIKAVVDQFIDTNSVLDRKNFVWDHFTHEDCLIDV